MVVLPLNKNSSPKNLKASRKVSHFEALEPRTLMSATLFVTAPAGVPDATHFQTLQSALTAALAGDSIVIQAGYTGAVDAGAGTISITKGIMLSAEAGVTLPFNLEVGAGTTGMVLSHLSGGLLTFDGGSFGNTVSESTFTQVVLKGGSHNNNFSHNSLGKLTAEGIDDASGHDGFLQNTFTGMVTINGNTSTATADTFTNNTFTVSSGDALTLFGASGTTVQGSTISDSSPFANGIVVHDADNVVLLNNQVTTTGMMGTGVYIFTDGTSSTSVDVRGNKLTTTSGYGLYIAKYDATAAMEVRAQGNDVRGNMIGAYIYGDGMTAGKVDFGGGTTRFGTSEGKNDFSSFTTANANHYAIGLFATTADFVVTGKNNFFGVADPLTVVADATHTPSAFGTGIVLGTLYVAPPPVTEAIMASVVSLSGIETGVVSGVVGHFSSNVAHVAGDFTVTIAWGDGTTSTGIVVANAGGGFDVMASHAWTDAGSYTFSMNVADSAASKVVQGSANISSRIIGVTGNDVNANTKSAFSGFVANFTDNLAGTSTNSYVASVAWSDGVTTAATIVKMSDGSFSILATRSFTKAGVMVGSVSIGTLDGIFSGTTSFSATVTTTKCEGKGEHHCKHLVSVLKHIAKNRSFSHDKPVPKTKK